MPFVHKLSRTLTTVAVLTLACAALPVQAAVRLPKIFTSNMVLQRDAELPIWGWAATGEEVTVSLVDSKATGKADEAGK